MDKKTKKQIEERLEGFLTVWRDKNWNLMVPHCQRTWLANQQYQHLQKLEEFFGHYELLSWKILKVQRTSDTGAKAKVHIRYKYDGKSRTGKDDISLICESAPYRPDSFGTWGINPVSAIKLLG